jgi:hypothetical protein
MAGTPPGISDSIKQIIAMLAQKFAPQGLTHRAPATDQQVSQAAGAQPAPLGSVFGQTGGAPNP